ncbi:hypothetical protein [Pelagicoccus mobilis]|uniref:hypothetical protein n=1 Tax=Pelagicoccus mobilis TaxID=415221 RepID=UPI0019062ED4|nr:hypothetical protein [Pelagicoccus mobilis]
MELLTALTTYGRPEPEDEKNNTYQGASGNGDSRRRLSFALARKMKIFVFSFLILFFRRIQYFRRKRRSIPESLPISTKTVLLTSPTPSQAYAETLDAVGPSHGKRKWSLRKGILSPTTKL